MTLSRRYSAVRGNAEIKNGAAENFRGGTGSHFRSNSADQSSKLVKVVQEFRWQQESVGSGCQRSRASCIAVRRAYDGKVCAIIAASRNRLLNPPCQQR